ncbi:hypothetical protein [Verrucomicrobium sp. BvORR106]|uniref:hypothetical protein n=1 Tax=Verrucomicrobium sp. BvORR106 TaxID=1403819 RepID=UPI0005710A90|nr:hypothetical protein [Verrucomicrobium sp. BvORR106]
MKLPRHLRSLISGLAAVTFSMATAAASEPSLKWEKLPALPDPEGFASMYSGVSHDTLLAAGGANFPGKRPWEGGTKVWYDTVWALNQPTGTWQKAGQLPQPLGYGASVTWRDEVICAGGSHSAGHVADVFALRLDQGKLVTRSLPKLPKPCANMSWALVNDVLYLSGGIERTDATSAMATLWSLRLSDANAYWQELPPCPGTPRMLAVAGAWEGAFYLFGGAGLQPGPDGKPSRIWLKDAWRYTAGSGWEKLPDLPRVAVAAPSPAPSVVEGLVIASGDDGSKVGFKPETDHPGFPKNGLLFSPRTGTWVELASVPFSLATAPVTPWQGGWVIPSGEARPGYRTPQVWFMKR